MRPVYRRLACAAFICVTAVAAAPAQAADDAAKDWATALVGAMKGLDPIAAAQIQELNPDLKLHPGLLRLRGVDPQDPNQRAALDALFRSLADRGYTPERLRELHLDETADPRVVEDFSAAYETGLARARAYSEEVARHLERSTTSETSPGALAVLQARLTAMALLYGDAAVAQAKDSLRRKLPADGAAAAVFFSLP